MREASLTGSSKRAAVGPQPVIVSTDLELDMNRHPRAQRHEVVMQAGWLAGWLTDWLAVLPFCAVCSAASITAHLSRSEWNVIGKADKLPSNVPAMWSKPGKLREPDQSTTALKRANPPVSGVSRHALDTLCYHSRLTATKMTLPSGNSPW